MIILSTVGIFAGIVINSILRGWVLTKMWLWFIVPVFAVSPLRIPQAIGISMLVGFLTYHFSGFKKDDRKFLEQIGEAFIVGVVHSLFGLALGWLVHLFL